MNFTSQPGLETNVWEAGLFWITSVVVVWLIMMGFLFVVYYIFFKGDKNGP